jgi:hypothetical protein
MGDLLVSEKLESFFFNIDLIVMSNLSNWKIKRFFMWPNSHGRPAQVKNFSKVKNFQRHFQFLAISRWPSFWWIPPGIFLMNFGKTHLFNVLESNDTHASLSDLKYRPLFFSQSPCCLIDEILLFFIWVLFIVWLLAYSSWLM